jgi:hypothetical protein
MQRPTWATVVGIIGIVMAIYTLLNSGAGLMMPQMVSIQQRGVQMQLDAQRQAAAEEKKSEAEEKKEEAEENKEDKSFDENQVKQSPDFKIPAAQQKFAEDNEKEMEAFSKQGDEQMKQAEEQGDKQMKQAEELGDKTVALYNIPVWYGPVAFLMSLIAMAIAACYLFTSIWLLMTKPSAVPLFSLACVVSIGFAILHGVVSMIAMPMWGMGMGMTGIVVAVVNVVLLIVVATGDKTAFQS